MRLSVLPAARVTAFLCKTAATLRAGRTLAEAAPGRPRLNSAFLQAGIVDQTSLLLWPAIDGKGGGAAIFEAGDTSVGPAPKLELMQATPWRRARCICSP